MKAISPSMPSEARKRSDANGNAPFNTQRNRGVLPAQSRVISLPRSLTRLSISSLEMYGTKVMPSYFTSFIADFKNNYAKVIIFSLLTAFLKPEKFYLQSNIGRRTLGKYPCTFLRRVASVCKNLYIYQLKTTPDS